jgi:hypothetical protein
MASDRDEPKRVASAGEYLLNEARYGVQDIRQKLFEEAWFGQVVTPAPVIEARLPEKEVASEPERTPERRPKFEDVWGTPSGRPEHDKHAKGRDEPNIER